MRPTQDSDPTGYKSKKAIAAKDECKIEAVVFPRYSPDLNPLDFSLWEAVMEKMWQNAPPEQETVAACKARLRRTALRLPRDTVRRAVCDIYIYIQHAHAGHNRFQGWPHPEGLSRPFSARPIAMGRIWPVRVHRLLAWSYREAAKNNPYLHLQCA